MPNINAAYLLHLVEAFTAFVEAETACRLINHLLTMLLHIRPV
jgi:hypothetical protein